MSDEDFNNSIMGRSSGHHDGGSHKKGPRFSWTPAYETTFFSSLCDSVERGLKDNHSFKQEAWDRAMQALQERHGAYPNKGHLINKSDNARKKFRLWRGLREDPRFLYNPLTRTVNASDEVWKQHIEKEPLSRSLRGRPFEHEEFYDVLFADVIGSGGAPKRLTKPRRKTGELGDTSMDAGDAPGTTIMHLLNDGGYTTTQQTPIPPPAPLPLAPTSIVPSQARPTANGTASTSMAPAPRASIVSSTALTPPDETVTPAQTRKRFAPADTPNMNAPAEKRRRTTNAGAHTANGNYIDLTNHVGGARPDSSITLLAEALSRSAVAPAPRWSDQAMDIFFRDFADEDMDLQLKIAEKMLTDTNKAAMFCKMPVGLRQHWIKRLREAHNRGIGAGLG